MYAYMYIYVIGTTPLHSSSSTSTKQQSTMAALRFLLLFLLLFLSQSPLMHAHEARALWASSCRELSGHGQTLQPHNSTEAGAAGNGTPSVVVFHGRMLERHHHRRRRCRRNSSSSSAAFRTMETSPFSVTGSLLCSSILLGVLCLP